MDALHLQSLAPTSDSRSWRQAGGRSKINCRIFITTWQKHVVSTSLSGTRVGKRRSIGTWIETIRRKCETCHASLIVAKDYKYSQYRRNLPYEQRVLWNKLLVNQSMISLQKLFSLCNRIADTNIGPSSSY
jgi:hypothetical protein